MLLKVPPLFCAGPEDIYGGNLKLILGLIWTLIKEYQIKSSGRGISTKKAMLAWINTIIPEYRISNFNTDWNDGRPICGIVDHIRPGACPDHFTLDSSKGLENCTTGMDLAESLLEIPKILSPEDLNNPDVDDLSVMTYLSYFCDPANQLLLQWIRKKIPDRNIKNLSTDWNSGINLGALVEACFPGLCPDWESMDPEKAVENNERMIGLIHSNIGLDCPIPAAELSDPQVDELIVATYLYGFKNAKLRDSPEEFRLNVPNLPRGYALVLEPVSFTVNVPSMSPEVMKELKVSAHGPSADVAVDLQPSGSGELTATLTPTEGGKYDIMASYQGENISGSPVPLPVSDPSKCQVFGNLPKYMQVGVPEEVTVKTRGAGVGSLTCDYDTPSDDDPLLVEIEENKENDEYVITFTPENIGEATVDMKWSGEHIPQSPFETSVCDASKCTLSGYKDEINVGEDITFKITARESEAGTAVPEVVPRGPSSTYTPEIHNNRDGTFDVKFTPWEVGPHKVDVIYGNKPASGSPLSMNVKTAPDALACSATGRGLKTAVAGVPTSFDILTPERGLLERENGIEVDIMSTDETEKAKSEIVDNGDGTYKVTYTADKPGSYSIKVKCYDKFIPGNPFELNVVSEADASKCKAEGPALHPNSLKIEGNPLDITVDTTEAGNGELQVQVEGPGGIEPTVYVASEDGIYSLKFDVPKPGRYTVNITWSGEHIPGSPYKLKVYPGPNAGAVKAYGPGLEPSFEVGEEGEFTIETKNAGIGTLTIRVHGVKGAFKIIADPVSPNDPRTMKARYDPQEPGDYIVAVRWSGTHVPGSPFNINIRQKPKPKKVKMQDDDENDAYDEYSEPLGANIVMKRQQMPPGAYMPFFHVSPTRGAPQRTIGQGGVLASKSAIIKERKYASQSATTKTTSYSQLDKSKKKKKKF